MTTLFRAALNEMAWRPEKTGKRVCAYRLALPAWKKLIIEEGYRAILQALPSELQELFPHGFACLSGFSELIMSFLLNQSPGSADLSRKPKALLLVAVQAS